MYRPCAPTAPYIPACPCPRESLHALGLAPAGQNATKAAGLGETHRGNERPSARQKLMSTDWHISPDAGVRERNPEYHSNGGTPRHDTIWTPVRAHALVHVCVCVCVCVCVHEACRGGKIIWVCKEQAVGEGPGAHAEPSTIV
jgi:hypothetical protein